MKGNVRGDTLVAGPGTGRKGAFLHGQAALVGRGFLVSLTAFVSSTKFTAERV